MTVTAAPVRVALYVRVSTGHQVQHQTVDQQLARLRAHVLAHAADGWVLDEARVFRDDGYSGATLTRPGLDGLRDVVKRAEVERVLVTAPDRLARNYVHQMVLLEEFGRAGCAVAEYERTLITERMRRGRLSKFRAGVLLPWTRPPYGYRVSPARPRDPRSVTVDPPEAAVVGELFALYLEPRMTLGRLATLLDARGVPTPAGRRGWGLPSIRGILRNPTYTGIVYAQRTRYREPAVRRSATHPLGRPHGTATPLPADAWLRVGEVPPLVEQARFDQVQAKLAENRRLAPRHNTVHHYLVRALVSCGACGLACTGRTMGGRNRYYVCSGRTDPHRAPAAGRCRARYVHADGLDALVWADLCALLAEPAHVAAAFARAQGGAWLPQALEARRETLRQARAALHQQLERLTDAYLRAVLSLDEYERRRRDLEQREGALAAHEAQLRGDAARQRELAGVAASLEAFRERARRGLTGATAEQRRELVLLLVDRVIVTGAEVEIRYVLPTSPDSEHVRFCQLRTDYFADPRAVRRRVRAQPEAPRQQGGRDRLGVRAVGRAHQAPGRAAHQPVLAHEPGDALLRRAHAGRA